MDNLHKTYKKSKDIIERDIDGEIIMIPVASDIIDLETINFFSLNEVAKEIWTRIDEKKSISEIFYELQNIYDVEMEKLSNDVVEFLEELDRKGLILEVGEREKEGL